MSEMKKRKECVAGEPLFYYIKGTIISSERKKISVPFATIAIAQIEGSDIFFRGIAICSSKDQSSKEEGRSWAVRRIIRANNMYLKSTGFKKDPINPNSKPIRDLCLKYNVEITTLPCLFKTTIVFFKQLTSFEQELIIQQTKGRMQ